MFQLKTHAYTFTTGRINLSDVQRKKADALMKKENLKPDKTSH